MTLPQDVPIRQIGTLMQERSFTRQPIRRRTTLEFTNGMATNRGGWSRALARYSRQPAFGILAITQRVKNVSTNASCRTTAALLIPQTR